MGRISYLIIATAFCGVTACSEATPAQPQAQMVAQIERPAALPCPSPDTDNACMADTHALQADFDKAMAGDYQAQRNTAFSLSGATPYVVAQPVQACAWRKVILANRPANAAFTDDRQVEIDCAKLSAEEHVTADQVAALISAQLAA